MSKKTNTPDELVTHDDGEFGSTAEFSSRSGVIDVYVDNYDDGSASLFPSHSLELTTWLVERVRESLPFYDGVDAREDGRLARVAELLREVNLSMCVGDKMRATKIGSDQFHTGQDAGQIGGSR